MSPADVARELLAPAINPVLLLATATFGGALWLALVVMRLGPLFLIMGVTVLLWVSSALFRYSVKVLECRGHGRGTPVADLDDLTPFASVWTFFPLVATVAAAWGGLALRETVGPAAGMAVLIVYVAFFPASLGVLAITHSPLQSVHPRALYELIRHSGPGYLWIPVVIASMAGIIALAHGLGAPLIGLVLGATYLLFAVAGLTGAVVCRAGIAGDVSIGAPAGRSEAAVRDDLAAERQKVLNHAYGFISRGNREGGFRHIRTRIAAEADAGDAVAWFFNEMMRWQRKDAALFFGQECFAHFLHDDDDAMALKIVSRCLHEDPAWRPRREDRADAVRLAERYCRDDLLPALRS